MSKTPEPLDLDLIERTWKKARETLSSAACSAMASDLVPTLADEVRRLRSLLSTMEAPAPLPPPLVWTAETIDKAPEGQYTLWAPDDLEWFTVTRTKSDAAQVVKGVGAKVPFTTFAYGPIPSPTEGPTV